VALGGISAKAPCRISAKAPRRPDSLEKNKAHTCRFIRRLLLLSLRPNFRPPELRVAASGDARQSEGTATGKKASEETTMNAASPAPRSHLWYIPELMGARGRE